MCVLCRIEELTCGGMVEQVQEAFGETMTSVVSLCARFPIACSNSIGMLCTIPYTRQDNYSLSSEILVLLLENGFVCYQEQTIHLILLAPKNA